MKTGWILCISTVVSVLASCSTPYEKAMKPLADATKAEILFPARANLRPGYTFRPADHQIMHTDCYEGTRETGTAFKKASIVLNYSGNTDLGVDWKDILALTVNYTKVSKIEVQLNTIKESFLANAEPTFKPHCLQNGYTPSQPVFGTLYWVDSFEVKFFDEKGVKVDLDPKLKNIKELANFDTKLTHKATADRNLLIEGKNTFVMFKQLDTAVDQRREDIVCTQSAICDGGISSYTMILEGISSNGKEAMIWVQNPAAIPPRDQRITLPVGGVFFLYESGHQRDYVQLRNIDIPNKRVSLRLESIRINIETGRISGQVRNHSTTAYSPLVLQRPHKFGDQG